MYTNTVGNNSEKIKKLLLQSHTVGKTYLFMFTSDSDPFKKNISLIANKKNSVWFTDIICLTQKQFK
jgi:hypothetical protein